MADPSEPGFRGVIDVTEWLTGDLAIARIIDPDDDNQPIFHVVIESPEAQGWMSRAFLTLEKDFVKRCCILRVYIAPGRVVNVIWHLDVNPWDLSPR